MEEKIRLFIKKRMDFGAKKSCDNALNAMNEVFNSEALERFGLKRDAATFADIMLGGTKSISDYRKALEKELPTNSKLAFLAENAKRQVEEGVGELTDYITKLQRLGTSNVGAHAMALTSDCVMFDEECGRIVLTDTGKEELDNLINVYLTTKKQVEAYNLAIEIKEKINALDSMLKDSHLETFSVNSPMGVISYSPKGAEVNAERLATL